MNLEELGSQYDQVLMNYFVSPVPSPKLTTNVLIETTKSPTFAQRILE
jgi:hypothetical protein